MLLAHLLLDVLALHTREHKTAREALLLLGRWLLPVLLPLGLLLLAPGFTRVCGCGFGCLALFGCALCCLGFGLLLLGLDGFGHLGFDLRLFFPRLLLAACPFGRLHLSLARSDC